MKFAINQQPHLVFINGIFFVISTKSFEAIWSNCIYLLLLYIKKNYNLCEQLLLSVLKLGTIMGAEEMIGSLIFQNSYILGGRGDPLIMKLQILTVLGKQYFKHYEIGATICIIELYQNNCLNLYS